MFAGRATGGHSWRGGFRAHTRALVAVAANSAEEAPLASHQRTSNLAPKLQRMRLSLLTTDMANTILSLAQCALSILLLGNEAFRDIKGKIHIIPGS